VKPALFDYHAPTTIEEAAALLHEHAEEAKVLAGGQSLVPMLALRLSRFEHLVDVNHVDELAGVDAEGEGLRIGAMTRQAVAERSAEVARRAPLLARALPFIGHFQIRNRGTVGGTIAHADPASELPAVACALDAEMEVASVRGSHRIAASSFFTSVWETALEPDELLVAVHLAAAPPRSGNGFEELAWRLGDFAIAGAACHLTLDAAGTVAHAAIALMGMGPTPLRAGAAEAALSGQDAGRVDLAEVAALALAGVSPVDDVHASAAYRLRVAAPMIRRVVGQALEEARRG